MTVFRLYQNAPFTFENNLLLTQEIRYSKNKISENIETKLNETQLPFGGGFVTTDGRDITGNETEIYLTFDYRRYKDWVDLNPNETYAGDIVKKTFDLLQSCNIIRAMYQIKAGKTKQYKTGDEQNITVKNYFFNIQSVEIVTAAPDDIEAYQQTGDNSAVWLTATAYRLKVTRNKLLEAYFEGFFDNPDNIQIRGGTISGLSCRSWKELLNGKSERKTRAAQNVTPAEKVIHSSSQPTITRLFTTRGYYVFISGTYSYTTSGYTGKPFSIGSELLIVVGENNKNPLIFGTAETWDELDYQRLMQISNAQKMTVAQGSTEIPTGTEGNYSPKSIYLVPCEFFGGVAPYVDNTAPKFCIYGDLEETYRGKAAAYAIRVLGPSPYIKRGKRYKVPKATPNTYVEFGTMTTRATLHDTLAISFSENPQEATIFPQITYSPYDSTIKAELVFSGGKLDITQDLIFPLSAQNITSSEAAAIAQQRQTGFVQQAGAVVAGVAAIGAAAVSGGAFLPAAAAIVGGATAVVGGLSGMQQTAAAIKNEKGITATQNGGVLAIATAQDLGGCGVWTYSPETDDDKKQYLHILYNAAINAAELVEDESENKNGDYNGLKFLKISYGIVGREFYGDSVILMQNARVNGLPREIAEEVETRLNAGAIICYGVDYLEALGG